VCGIFYIDLAAVTYIFENWMDCKVSIFLQRKFLSAARQMTLCFRYMANGTKIVGTIRTNRSNYSNNVSRSPWSNLIIGISINTFDRFHRIFFVFLSAHIVFLSLQLPTIVLNRRYNTVINSIITLLWEEKLKYNVLIDIRRRCSVTG